MLASSALELVRSESFLSFFKKHKYFAFSGARPMYGDPAPWLGRSCTSWVSPSHTKDGQLHCVRSATRGCAVVVDKALALDTAKEPDVGIAVEDDAAVPWGRNRSGSESQPSKSAVCHRCHFRSKVDLLDFNPFAKGVSGKAANPDILANFSSHFLDQIGHRH